MLTGTITREDAELRARIDRLCRTPIDPAALDERLRHAVELTHREPRRVPRSSD